MKGPAFFTSVFLSGGLMIAAPVVQAGPMQDIGAASGPQCAGLDVNNSGYVVGACAETNGSASGFVALAPGSAVDLAHLVDGRSCMASAITNVGRVVGRCMNSNSLPTGVVWNATAPTTIQALQALAGGVRTKVTALAQSGAVAGVSLNADNTGLPVMWRNNETTARSLPAGLLGLVATNCVPSDVDDHSVNPTMPSIVGNCPGTNGRPQPVLWSPGLLGTYASAALPLPPDALHCRASQVVNSRILGQCDFGAQGGHAALWSNPASAPLVVSTGVQRSSARALNASGQVIGKYTNTNGDTVPFLWDTTTNVRTDIPAPAGGLHASVSDIGDNGNVVGRSEMGDGTRHAFKWTLSGGSVDLGTLPGGKNSGAIALSQDGCYLTGGSESGSGQDTHAFVQNLCAP
jgi:probable HAF family extracellular repeat protein